MGVWEELCRKDFSYPLQENLNQNLKNSEEMKNSFKTE